jgi:hypothetical protein
VRLLPNEVTVRESGPDWIRFQAVEPEVLNPMIIDAMSEAGIRIVTLSEVRRSLEEVYLSVMQTEDDP